MEKLLFIKSKLKNYKPIEPDIIINESFDLSDYGITGKVIHTPGHTECSISVILDSKEAIAGDMLNGKPENPVPSIFIDDETSLMSNLKKLIDMNVQLIYCGHGGPYKRENVINLINNL